MNFEKPLECKYITQCSGCQIAHLSKDEQIEFKKLHFKELWQQHMNCTPEVEFQRPVESHFRDRMDVTVSRDGLSQSCEDLENIDFQRIGFYKKDSRDILDIDVCPLNSEGLSRAYAKLRKINFPIQKGSLRIRVSPKGQAGLWLDFSNQDIKKLLDEANTSPKNAVLKQLLEIFEIVEIGQKRKKLSFIEGAYKLTDPEMHSWFETYDSNFNSIPLKMNVGGFSQSGFTTNKVLIENLIDTLKLNLNSSKNSYWLELCSGSGNLTLPLIHIAENVVATELDENAVNSLQQTAQELNLSNRLRVEKINIHKPSEKIKALLQKAQGVLADPPRSGLQGFLEVISSLDKKDLPLFFVYVSCFAETLISDLKVLTELGYKPQRIIGVDQFPHSTHCEWVTLLKLKD